jgi:hypothetical protein
VGERARLAGLDGSWFAIAGGSHAGWWVAESSAVHVIGQSERVGFEPSGTVTLEPGRQLFTGLESGAPQRLARVPSTAARVAVDERVIVDGRGYASLADGSLAGTWIEVAADFVPEGSRVTRSTDVTELPEGTTAALDAGALATFTFDADGRVTHRAEVDQAVDASLAVDRRMEVGGRPFIRLASGELAGSWVPESNSVRLIPAGGATIR